MELCHFRDLQHNDIYEIKVDTFHQLLSLRSLWVLPSRTFPPAEHFLSLLSLPLIFSFHCICVLLGLFEWICYENANILLMILSRNKFKSRKFVLCYLPISRTKTLMKRKEATLLNNWQNVLLSMAWIIRACLHTNMKGPQNSFCHFFYGGWKVFLFFFKKRFFLIIFLFFHNSWHTSLYYKCTLQWLDIL